MQFLCLTNPVVMFDPAFEFFQLCIDPGQIRRPERRNLAKLINAEFMQCRLEDFADANDLL